MAFFPRISEGRVVQAENAVKAAETGKYRGYDYADLVVAGAALAIEKGAPGMFSDFQAVETEDFFIVGSRPNQAMINATARFMHMDEHVSATEMPRDKAVKMIVADIAQQESADKISLAVSGKLPVSELNDSQKAMMKSAQEDPELLADFTAMGEGRYSDLSPFIAEALEQVLAMPIRGELGVQTELMARAVKENVDHSANMDSSFLSADRSFDKFETVGYEAFKSLTAFREHSIPTGDHNVDGALRLLSSVGALAHDGNPIHVENIAQARLIQSADANDIRSSSALAASAMSEAAVIYEHRGIQDPSDDQAKIGHGAFEAVSEEMREKMARRFYFADDVSPVDKIKLEAHMLQGVGDSPQLIKALNADPAELTPTVKKELQDAMHSSLAKVSLSLVEEVKDQGLSETEDLLEAVYARNKDGSAKNNRWLMDAAEGLVHVLDDKSLSNTPSFDKVAITIDRINDRQDLNAEIANDAAKDVVKEPAQVKSTPIAKVEPAQKATPIKKVEPAMPAQNMTAMQLAMQAAMASRGMG